MTNLQEKLGLYAIIGGSFAVGTYLGYQSGKGTPVTGLEGFALTYVPAGISAVAVGTKLENDNSSSFFPGLGLLMGGAGGGFLSFASQGAGYLTGLGVSYFS